MASILYYSKKCLKIPKGKPESQIAVGNAIQNANRTTINNDIHKHHTEN